MAADDILIPAQSNDGALKVDAKRLFTASMKKVDEGLNMLAPLAKTCANALPGRDADESAGSKAILDGYIRMQEMRAKLASEQAKLLVEMQKDLNKCAIERYRIGTAGKEFDLKNIPADAIKAALNA